MTTEDLAVSGVACASPLSALRAYCVRIVRFVSGDALDPHLYFERKLIADIGAARSDAEVRTILLGLLDWIVETNVRPERIAQADAALAADGCPSLSLLLASATRAAGLVLAGGRALTRHEFELVETLAARDGVNAADRGLAAVLLDNDPNGV